MVPTIQQVKQLHQTLLTPCVFLLLLVSALLTPRDAAADDASTSKRVEGGLLALYDFVGTGAVIEDRSGSKTPLPLRIANPQAVRRQGGTLEIRGKTLIRSEKPATRLGQAIGRTGSMTLEAWVESADLGQSGPARIVSLSRSSTLRNLTLGQDGHRFDVRLRTTKTSNNGIPSFPAKANSVKRKLTHVVFTRERGGTSRIFLNGRLHQTRDIKGSLSGWDKYHLLLGNEFDQSRPWKGTYYLVALYDRKLTTEEVLRNFQAGPGATNSPQQLARQQVDPKALHFERTIAPLLANHCLECHDSASQGGELDLSKKVAALQGGESGSLLVAGNADESLLWHYVESDEMPKDRPPLSSAEKSLLREWIASGATWSLATLDPANYTHASRASQNWLRRLTREEYIATVRDAVGVDVSAEARKLLPPDLRADGFSNTAYNLNVDLKHVDAYRQLAELIVQRIDPEQFARRFTKSLSYTDKDMGNLIAKMGRWLLRGPIDEQEVIAYRGIATTAVANGRGEAAIGLLIEAMLQSPRFIYRMENQQGDGDPVPADEYELASRLSYILWGGPPDENLYRAAENGDLFSREGCLQQVQRMLQDPRAIAQSQRFVSEWLNLGRLANMRPSPQKYPRWNEQLAADMRRETLAFAEEVLWKQNRPLADLLNAQLTFLTPRLAQHYGLSAPGSDADAEALVRVDLKTHPSRGGLLTQGSVLTVGGDEASMVTRGLFVMHELLRGVVKAPPPCVDTTPVPTKSGLTQRAIAMTRIENKNCGGCHSKFEPLAFGLEKFNGLGHFDHQDEHGNALRDDGEVLIPGTAGPVPYGSSAELMDILANSPRVGQSLTWKLAQFALGRPLGAADAAEIDKMHRAAQEAGGTYRDVMTELVLSDLVQLKATEADSNP